MPNMSHCDATVCQGLGLKGSWLGLCDSMQDDCPRCISRAGMPVSLAQQICCKEGNSSQRHLLAYLRCARPTRVDEFKAQIVSVVSR